MSEFYDSRRTVITDLSALSGLSVGVLIASAFAWRVLATGFRTGELERALFYFLALVLGSGLIGGALGLWTGRVGGRIWERHHRRQRMGTAEDAFVAQVPAPMPDAATLGLGKSDERSGLSFRSFGAEVDQFLVLLRRASPRERGAVRTASNLSRTVNIGAYDGERLVGAIRILTDGHFSHVAELLVDPDYSSHGLSDALRERADRLTRGTQADARPSPNGLHG